MYICAPSACLVPEETRRGRWSNRRLSEVTWVLGTELGLQEQKVLLTTELYFQIQEKLFLKVGFWLGVQLRWWITR